MQFFIESRDLDIRPYIALLEERYVQELDDLMKIQIREYIAFIKDFTARANIMSKNFFIVVPYDPALIGTRRRRRRALLAPLCRPGLGRPRRHSPTINLSNTAPARAARVGHRTRFSAHRRAHCEPRHRRGDRVVLQAL